MARERTPAARLSVCVRRKLVIFTDPWFPGHLLVAVDRARNGENPRLSWFGTASAILLASLPDRSAAGSGRKTMTFNSANLQQLAISALGALFAATLFISAAVGPAGQLV
jgi:hypothetical protein